jgi:hypothetical protein
MEACFACTGAPSLQPSCLLIALSRPSLCACAGDAGRCKARPRLCRSRHGACQYGAAGSGGAGGQAGACSQARGVWRSGQALSAVCVCCGVLPVQ